MIRNKSKSQSELVHDIAIIKAKAKERQKTLQPLKEVVDIQATIMSHVGVKRDGMEHSDKNLLLSPKALIIEGRKLKKNVNKYGYLEGIGVWLAMGHQDPRRMQNTTKYGLLRLQTRLDEHGRVIPGWQREKKTAFVLPIMGIFFFGPQIGDWLLGWGA